MSDQASSPLTRMTRRALLNGAGSLAALAVWPGEAPALAKGQQRAEPGDRSALPAFDPYANRTASGPSSRAVPAVGTTPSVPGAPYILPVAPGWSVVSLLTAGNTARSGYRMTGLPDGLGAFGNDDGTITLLMNHELAAGKSLVRGHGGSGAFVSRWRIDIASLEVLDGRDMVTSPANWHLWTGRGWTTAAQILAQPEPKPLVDKAGAVVKLAGAAKPGTVTASAVPRRVDVDIDRLCSADAAPVSAFWDAAHGLGYNGHILLNGEESESRRGRALAWVDATRSVYELPAFATVKPGDTTSANPEWENLLANPRPGRKTVVIANSDGGPSRVYVYIGRKQRSGSAIEKAGLTNGRLYSLRVGKDDYESRDTSFGLSKSRLGQPGGAAVSLVAQDKGTSFLRPEDGAWHPGNPDVYFFTTTDRNNFASPDSVTDGADAGQVGRSRLWAVTFDDVQAMDTDGAPTARLQLLLDGSEGGDMFDNITVDREGIIYLCEDTGEARHNGKIWSYDTNTGALEAVMKFDPALFGDVTQKAYMPPTPPFIDDKETSGILDVTELFEPAPWFKPDSTVLLAVVQPHFGYDGGPEVGRHIYEGGQLVLLVKAP